MKRVECVTAQEALDLLRYCMGENGSVVEGRHFRDKLRVEGIEIDEAYFVMRSGTIYEPPEEDISTGEWKWKIEGLEPDGRWLAIVFSFKTVRCTFLITIYSVEAQGRRGRLNGGRKDGLEVQ